MRGFNILSIRMVAAGVIAASTAGCPKQPGPMTPTPSGNESPVTSTVDDLRRALKDRTFDAGVDFFKGRTLAPSISSMEQNPALALGTVFVRRAKVGKKCDSENEDDFTYERQLDVKEDKNCVQKVFPGRNLVTKTVAGGGSAKFGYIVGSTAVDVDAAFEFYISEPMTAVFESTSKCISATSAQAQSIPDRVCSANWIVGAVLTEVAYKTYSKIKADTNNGWGAITVGGNAYAATNDLDTKYFLTVDVITLDQFFDTDATTGFLKKKNAAPSIGPNVISPQMVDNGRETFKSREAKVFGDRALKEIVNGKLNTGRF